MKDLHPRASKRYGFSTLRILRANPMSQKQAASLLAAGAASIGRPALSVSPSEGPRQGGAAGRAGRGSRDQHLVAAPHI